MVVASSGLPRGQTRCVDQVRELVMQAEPWHDQWGTDIGPGQEHDSGTPHLGDVTQLVSIDGRPIHHRFLLELFQLVVPFLARALRHILEPGNAPGVQLRDEHIR
jgi:hypothetical protein